MDYRHLGRTGVRVSPLCLGCMMFGAPGKTSLDDSCAIIDKALDAGVNFLDTANVYSTGESERVVGEALHRNGHRDFIVLATKCHGNMWRDPGDGGDPDQRLRARLNPNQWGNSRRQIIEQCEASLQRLRTDRIDLLQLHRPHPDCAIDESLRALDDLVRSGKVRYIGTSTFGAWQFVESLWTSEKLGLNRFVTEQPPYNLLDRRIERELIPMARTFSVALIPWSPLAGGFLTGKYRRDGQHPVDGRFSDGTHGRSGKLLSNQPAFDVVDKLAGLAADKGCELTQLALAWCMSQPGITSPIIGPRTMAQLDDNLQALNVTITDDDRRAIDQIIPPGTHVSPFYEAPFGPHPHRV
jgi:aryl-alcohol dehydrogenase-like predicted oxidoreductase